MASFKIKNMKIRMKKINGYLIIALAALFTAFMVIPACGEDDVIPDDVEQYILGWIGADEENLDEMEEDIDIDDETEPEGLPSSVDLRSKFPPIGNQGQYGTCVAWSVGYNLRTYLEGIDQGYSSTQLASTSNQFSPKDLFWAISTADKGEDCNGTGFEVAMDVLVSRGVAKLSDVPYTSMGDCSSSPDASWTSAAADYKIESYRKVDHTSIAELKDYLADGRAMSIGAKLGDNFMEWNSDDVISSDTYLNPGMMHAYHAMVLCGYDDNVGPNGAFKVINSWGTSWGDNGYIWVDYNFFVNEFCFCAFVAQSKTTSYSMPGSTASGYDVVGWALADEHDPTDYGTGDDPLNRKCNYNVYNIGTNAINADNDWNILYLYYNAYDANDYGVILYDYYSDDYGAPGANGNLADETGATLYGFSGNWWNYIDVPSGMSVADACYGGTGNYFQFTYAMPTQIPDINNPGYNKAFSGKYYMVMIADGFDGISEYDEANNYLYYAQENGDPFEIIDGVVQDGSVAKAKINKFREKPTLHAASPFGTVRTSSNVNAYSPFEITRMIMNHKKSGKLQQKINEYKAAHPKKSFSKKVVKKVN
ncbi:MAG: hypothetical protein A2W91_08170 [Bacteroidetes bacterium GWF2_38_335]|nr:MAG: hypothetical protein A2W91_08170 [Bacteroidetes bacterium GWF2_38_335]OFY78980.1 MAG: hypothetical protein A2281_02550 [Bacteroidetes bacterium RIFOXYA12_FULL_38_20]HBS86051.1 hypothetical protein [Bacteroidales bacterium]